MGDLSKNFSSSEWVCSCGCKQLIIVQKLVDMMQLFRDRIDKPINVHCVNRCKIKNESLPGSSKISLHLDGAACDFHVPSLSIPELHTIVLSSDDIFTGGIGLYDWGCHIDTGKKRIWDNRS